MVNENLLCRAKVEMLQFREQLAHEFIHDQCFEEESHEEQQREAISLTQRPHDAT
jgi:hypothetical protein